MVETLEWTNTTTELAAEINLSVIAAQSGAFTLTGAITVDGESAASAFLDHVTNLRVSFPRAIEPGETTTIVIPFRLKVPRDAELPGEWDSSHAYLVAGDRTLRFGYWFPVWSTVHGWHPVGEPQVTYNADRMTLDLTSTRDLGVDAVAATGVLQPGATASHWLFSATNVRDFGFVVSPRFTLSTSTVSCDGRSITLNAYMTEGDAELALRDTAEAFDSFNEWFGCYPYPAFSLAEASGPWFSIEFPTISLVTPGALVNKALVHHEVAHQWWYGIVGNDQMLEPWIDEAFAQYSERMIDGLPIEHCEGAGEVGSTVYEFEEWMDCNYYATVYLKGSAFLDEVRQRLGGQHFIEALRDIVATYRYDIATTEGVLAILQEHSERDLSRLFARFGLP